MCGSSYGVPSHGTGAQVVMALIVMATRAEVVMAFIVMATRAEAVSSDIFMTYHFMVW